MCAVITVCAALSLCSATFDPIPSPQLDGSGDLGDLHERFSLDLPLSGIVPLPGCERAILDSQGPIVGNQAPAHSTRDRQADETEPGCSDARSPVVPGSSAVGARGVEERETRAKRDAGACVTTGAASEAIAGSRERAAPTDPRGQPAASDCGSGIEPCLPSGGRIDLARPLFAGSPGVEIVEVAPSSRRPGALVPLYLSLAALQGADAATTVLAVRAGGREMNPVVEPIAGNWGAMLAVKSFSAGITIVAAERLWKKNRAAAIATMAGINALYGYLVARNAQHLRESMRRAPSR